MPMLEVISQVLNGTRVPRNTGSPLMISGLLTIVCDMGKFYSSSLPFQKIAHRFDIDIRLIHKRQVPGLRHNHQF